MKSDLNLAGVVVLNFPMFKKTWRWCCCCFPLLSWVQKPQPLVTNVGWTVRYKEPIRVFWASKLKARWLSGWGLWMQSMGRWAASTSRGAFLDGTRGVGLPRRPFMKNRWGLDSLHLGRYPSFYRNLCWPIFKPYLWGWLWRNHCSLSLLFIEPFLLLEGVVLVLWLPVFNEVSSPELPPQSSPVLKRRWLG